MPPMPGARPTPQLPKDEKAVANNKRIRECQKPILLNWALCLQKQGEWKEAWNKCQEVLLDIEKDNVKALFRRAQCNIQLNEVAQAKADLDRAEQLDSSIASEVRKERAKLQQKQKLLDKKDRGWASKVFAGGLGDERSDKPVGGYSAPVAPKAAAQKKSDEDDDLPECYVKESSATRMNCTGGPTATLDENMNP